MKQYKRFERWWSYNRKNRNIVMVSVKEYQHMKEIARDAFYGGISSMFEFQQEVGDKVEIAPIREADR